MVGPFEKELLKVLDDIKVERQAYHSNVFVGNHCKIILKKFSKLCDVISKREPEVCRKFYEVFGVFSGAHYFMSFKQLLSDNEIDHLISYCREFGRPCLTRKMHKLIFHVPSFVLKHKTVGLFSEEEGESVHKVVNQQSRQLCSVRKIGERNLLIHKNLELASCTSRKPLEEEYAENVEYLSGVGNVCVLPKLAFGDTSLNSFTLLLLMGNCL